MSEDASATAGRRDAIILGAGMYGLIAAKTYLQMRPDINLTIVDGDSSVGGVWSLSRVYDGLVVDSPAPIFEFSDLQMMEEFKIPRWSDISGKLMHEYLERYAKKFDLLRRCVFETQVSNVEKDGKGWKLLTKHVGKETTFFCDILIVATGQCTKPKLPDLDMSNFEGLMLHAKDRHRRQAELASDKIKTVVVVGGNKSSVEAAAASAMAGKTVHWLIREDGAGSGMLLNARMASDKHGAEIALCRFMDFQTPSIHGYGGWWHELVLSGKYSLGKKFFNWFWEKLTATGLRNRYEKSENGRLLKPEVCNLFWSPSGISFAHENENKFMDIVDEGKLVHVARTSIVSMSGKTVTLSNGKTISADAIIFCTGWQPALSPIFSNELKTELGLPVPKDNLPPSDTAYWQQLDDEAEKQVLDIFPILAEPPKNSIDRKHDTTPYRLLHTIIPPKLAAQHDHSIAFLGQTATTQHALFAETSSLWAVAYLEGMLELGTKEELDIKIALENAFMRKRYPGRKNIPWCVLGIRSWMDVMLKELGVRADRQRLAWERSENKGFGWWGWKAWWQEWFIPYEPAIYRGIVEEALQAHARAGGEAKKRV